MLQLKHKFVHENSSAVPWTWVNGKVRNSNSRRGRDALRTSTPQRNRSADSLVRALRPPPADSRTRLSALLRLGHHAEQPPAGTGALRIGFGWACKAGWTQFCWDRGFCL